MPFEIKRYFDNGPTQVFIPSSGGGSNGIELQKSSTHIQWRTVGASTWINLVALSDITGAQGPRGDARLRLIRKLYNPVGYFKVLPFSIFTLSAFGGWQMLY